MDGNRVYLDWAAATPLLLEAKVAMEPFLTEQFANPSAIYAEGQASRQAVETARADIATAVQVRPEYVTFTGGGTEGNNLAVIGLVEALHSQGRTYESMSVITTKIEHPSIGQAMAALKKRGVQVDHVQVTESGKINLQHLHSLLNQTVVLVSTALINSEIGTIQPTRLISKVLRTAEQQHGTQIALHLDAAQAPLWLQCQFDALAADLVTFDAAKCCGPKGVGVLVRSKRAAIAPVVYGGGQERGLRPGTENVAGVVGAAVAMQLAQSSWEERAEQVAKVRDAGIAHLQSVLPQALLNGGSGVDRVANNINISLPGLDTEYAAVVLDSKGFAVSTKSACSGAGGGASTVVLETTADPARATSTLRFTLGPDTTLNQLESLTEVLKKHYKQMSQY